MSWETISTEKMVGDYHVSVMKKVRLPDGAVIDDFYTVMIPDAAMVAVLTTDGCILSKKEFRYACGEEMIQCPAETFEPGEDVGIVRGNRV